MPLRERKEKPDLFFKFQSKICDLRVSIYSGNGNIHSRVALIVERISTFDLMFEIVSTISSLLSIPCCSSSPALALIVAVISVRSIIRLIRSISSLDIRLSLNIRFVHFYDWVVVFVQ